MHDPVQQQLITARRNQILDAAAIVFAEKGFHPTTTKDIAKQAGVSEGTIYNYFDSKSGLLLGIFERMKATIVQQELPPVPDGADVRAVVTAILYHPLNALKQDDFALFRIVISEMLVNEELRALYYQQILAPTLALAEGFLQQQFAQRDLDPAAVGLITRAISGMVLGLLLEHIMGDALLAEQWDQLPGVLADLIVNGLEGGQG
jgi:TetR/AcrR family fatty acid metabolism transcriptional regulator